MQVHPMAPSVPCSNHRSLQPTVGKLIREALASIHKDQKSKHEEIPQGI